MSKILVIAEHLGDKLNPSTARAVSAAIAVKGEAVDVLVLADSVDAIAAFVDHIETLQLGTPQCANGLMDSDSADPDTFKDLYTDVVTGTPVCWKVVSKQNTTVMPTENPQLFKATITVFGDGVTQLDTRDVYFLVPPKIDDGPIVKR